MYINFRRWILLVAASIVCCLTMDAKLPFKDADEYIEYMKNLDLSTVKTTKTIEDYMDPVGAMPTSPALLKGISMFNSGKHEEAYKYFAKISRNYKKYTDFEREYAEYQTFHIEAYGMLDEKYCGRPTLMDRSKGMTINSVGGYASNDDCRKSILILHFSNSIKCADPYDKLYKCVKYDYQREIFFEDVEDLEMLHVMLKTVLPKEHRWILKNFPERPKINDSSIYDFFKPEYCNETLYNRSVSKLFATQDRLPIFEKLLKGLRLDMEGKHEKAFKYFAKLEKEKNGMFNDYARYQCWHIRQFGKADPYYDGRPSNIDREVFGMFKKYHYKNWKKRKGDIYWADYKNFILLHAKYAPSEVLKSVFFSTYSKEGDNSLIYPYMCAYVNYSIFPPGGDSKDVISTILNCYPPYDPGYVYEVNFNECKRRLRFLPMLSRMKIDNENLLGVGMSANELYREGLKYMPEIPTDFKFDKPYKWSQKDKVTRKGNIYLLRSALWGNPDALMAFLLINSRAIWSYNSSVDPSPIVCKSRSEDLMKFN